MSTIPQSRLSQILWHARLLATIALFFLIAQAALASSDARPRHANNGFLFSIEKSDKKSYLLGTIHSGLSDDQQLGDNIVSTLQKSSRIFVEADTSDPNAVTLALDKAAFSGNGPGLRSLIGDKYYQFFGHWLVDEIHFLPVEKYVLARPWFIAMVIPLANPKFEPTPMQQYGCEEQIFTLAKKKDLEIEELEGLNSQFALFSSMTPEQESEYFRAYIDRYQDRTLYHRALAEIDAWTKSDFAALEEVVGEGDRLTDPYSHFWFENVVHKRNRSLSEKIARLSAVAGGQFFAIGELHLAGPDGVIAELEKAGFTITRLK